MTAITRNQLIEEIARDKTFRAQVKNYLFRYCQYWEDYFQDALILAMSKADHEIDHNQNLRGYIMEILKFKRKELTAEKSKKTKYVVPEDVWELPTKFNESVFDSTQENQETQSFIDRRINHFSSWTGDTSSPKIEDWYERNLYKIYLEEDRTIYKVSQKTGISRQSIKQTIEGFEAKIFKSFKEKERSGDA